MWNKMFTIISHKHYKLPYSLSPALIENMLHFENTNLNVCKDLPST